MSDNQLKIKKLLRSQNEIEVDLSSSGHIQPEFPNLQELRKNSVNVNSVSSFTFERQQSNNQIIYQEKQGLLLRFLRILQRKSLLTKVSRQNLPILQYIFQEKSLRQHFKSELLQSRYLIHPKKTTFLMFQFLKCLLLIMVLIIITYLWGFRILNNLGEEKIHFIIAFVLLLDILSQFNIAIIFRGQMIYDRKTICYRKGNFYLFIILSGMINLFKMIQQLEELIDLNPKNMELFKLIKLLFLLNLIAHFIACIWHFVGDIGDFQQNWIDAKGIRLESNFVIYIYSFYWSVTTMATVGYGDITPQNYLEMIVCIFSMFLSCGIYAYSLNIIGQIVQTFTQQSDKLEKNIRALNKYFKQHNIKEQLQSRIKNYLEYKILEEDWYKHDDIYQILNELPIHFKSKLLSEVSMKLLKQCPILFENFTSKQLYKVSNIITPITFEVDEFIIKQNHENENALYFIDTGTVQLYEQQSKTVITELKSGEYFGDYEFFTNQSPKYSIKCKTATKVLKLNRSDFLEILNKDSFETFHEIKYKMEYKIPIKQQRICLACQQHDHLIQNCNRIYYNPNMKKLFLRQENLKQIRSKFSRSYIRSNSLRSLELVQKKQYHLVQHLEQESSPIEIASNEFQNIEIDTQSQTASIFQQKLKLSDVNDLKYDTGQNKKRSSQNSQNQQIPSILHTTKKLTFIRAEKPQEMEQINELERMKDYNNFFSNQNPLVLIKSYNKKIQDRSKQFYLSMRNSKALKYIEY